MDNTFTVLIIDDDKDSVSVLLNHLESFKASVQVSNTGKEALACIEQNFFNIILLDLGLPDCSGYDLISQIRSQHPLSSIIIITGDCSLSNAQKAMREGATAFLTKPANVTELEFSITQSLEKQNLELENQRLFNNVKEELIKRKVIEKRLEYEKYLLQTLMNNFPDAIYFKDEESKFTRINKALAEVLGTTEDEAVGKSDFDFFAEVHANEAYADEQSIIKNCKPIINKVEKDVKPDGWERWVSTTKVPIFDQDGKTVGIVGVSRDISDIKQTQIALEKSEEKFRTLFESLHEPMFITSFDGKIYDINKAALTFLGYKSREEASRHNLFLAHFGKVDLKDYFSKIKSYRVVKAVECTIQLENDTEKVVELSTSLINDDEMGELLRIIMTDVSDRIANEKLLKKYNDELKDANTRLLKTQSNMVQHEKMASIGQLAAGVAHELNNPLAFISSNFSTLESYMKALKKYIRTGEKYLEFVQDGKNDDAQNIAQELNDIRQREDIDFILDDVNDIFVESLEGFERITKIVQSLRDFSRVDSEGNKSLYDLNKSLADTLNVARNEIKYVADVDHDYGDVPSFFCNGSEVNQVFLNIIVNAAQAIKSLENRDKGIIKIKSFVENDYAIVEISDTGPGIHEDIKKKIFDPFFTTKPEGSGTGLGLSISYDIIVNKNNGKLTVDSELGKGTTFKIMLPLLFEEK